VKPIDEKLLHEVFDRFDHVITIEDGVIQGGAGSAVLEWANDHGFRSDILRLGLPDEFIEHGTQRELHDMVGIGPDGIYERTLTYLRRRRTAVA
jgi:1-deoxy-D-xylulose-5-phosphate synthase